eukprot:TRINITY_DN2573_c0_g1_i1.p1 TRINITY_DN2573_c0_g1~~TRINITY_DN2573_c0_g1_i1.p1  ORF type:complete len:209 (+),score=23.16 TRINITY_DN2573_c0_g1_i1:74-700(+)
MFKKWREQKLPSIGITLSGHSKAAERTAFYVNEHKWFFDAGVIDCQNPKTVFISHCHQDHTMSVPLMLTHKWTLDVYAPASTAPFIKNYIIAATELNENSKIQEDRKGGCKYTIHALEPGSTVKLEKEKFIIKVIECDHSVPTIGYCISEQRNKIKDEYKGLPGKEIGQLIKQGVEVCSSVLFPIHIPKYLIIQSSSWNVHIFYQSTK